MRWLVGVCVAALVLVTTGCFAPSGALAGTGPTVGVSDPLWFDTGVSRDETLDEGEYWLVYVGGSEKHELKDGSGGDRQVECPSPKPIYKLDRDNRSLAYDPDVAKMAKEEPLTIVLVIDFFGVGFGSKSVGPGCPREYRIETFEQKAEEDVVLENFGSIRLTIYPRDGPVGVVGPEPNMTFVLPLSQGLGYEYTTVASTDASEYWVSGRWHVQNMGAWPKDGLKADL